MTGLLWGRCILVLLGAAVVTYVVVGTVTAQTTSALAKPHGARAAPLQLQARKPLVKPASVTRPRAAVESRPVAAAPAAAEPGTVFDDHIRQSRIVRCARMFGALGRQVSANSAYTAQSAWDSGSGNDHSIQSLISLVPPPNAPTRQLEAGIVFAAPVGSSCEGHLTRVTPVAENCGEVAARLVTSQGQNSVLGDLSVLAMPNGAEVMLIPFNQSCIAVTVLRGTG